MSLYQEARAAFRELNLKPRKRLGQHFLIHEGVIEAILKLVQPSAEDEILEIGPGLGFVTRRLLEAVRKVWAVEIDPLLVEWLKRAPLGSHPGLELIQGDILKVPLEAILPGRKLKLVGNLPYGISTPVLFRIFELRERFSSLVIMLQREVADRLRASPGSRCYGTLSVWCQIHGKIVGRVPVSPEAFIPRPKVASTVLRIDLFSEPLVGQEDLPALRAIVRSAFGLRRKTLENALKALVKDKAELGARLVGAGIDPRRRGETLGVREFIGLAHAFREVIKSASP